MTKWKNDAKEDVGMKNKYIKAESKQYILPKKKVVTHIRTSEEDYPILYTGLITKLV